MFTVLPFSWGDLFDFPFFAEVPFLNNDGTNRTAVKAIKKTETRIGQYAATKGVVPLKKAISSAMPFNTVNTRVIIVFCELCVPKMAARRSIFLPNWYIKMVKPGKVLPKDQVQFHVPMK